MPDRNSLTRGQRKGVPVRFILGHVNKRPPNKIVSDAEGTWLLFSDGSRSHISPSDASYIGQRQWNINGDGYVFGCGIQLHAALLGGSKPGYHIDHINRNKLDNRRENLRFVPPVVNVRNHGLHSRNTSGHNGVRWVSPDHTVGGKTYRRWKDGKGRWHAYINIDRRQHSVGHYKTLEEAIEARRAAEEKYWLQPTGEAV